MKGAIGTIFVLFAVMQLSQSGHVVNRGCGQYGHWFGGSDFYVYACDGPTGIKLILYNFKNLIIILDVIMSINLLQVLAFTLLMLQFAH